MLEVSAAELQIVRTILRRQVPGMRVLAYGSRATGKARATSDLDLALVAPSPIAFATLGMLQEEFAESDLPFRVDVVDLGSTTADFQALVMAQGQVIDAAHGAPGAAATTDSRLRETNVSGPP